MGIDERNKEYIRQRKTIFLEREREREREREKEGGRDGGRMKYRQREIN